jgi:predicted NAD/FAD-dependent oxidoreductase
MLSIIFHEISTMNLKFAQVSASNVNFFILLKEAVIAWSACSQFSSSASTPPSNSSQYFHCTSSGWLQHIRRRSINTVDNLLDAYDIIFHKQLTSSAHFTLYIKHAFIEANKLYNSINVPRRQLR